MLDQVISLIEILKQTPQMALWGIGMYFLFILLKAASWIGAVTLIFKLFITRFFDWKENQLRTMKETINAESIIQVLDKDSIGDMKPIITELFLLMKKEGHSHVFPSDVRKAIDKLKSGD